MKVLKTYGRRFKTSFLEVGKSSRLWSPEVVRVRSPNDRFETIFDSLQAKSKKSKAKAAVVTTDTSKGNDDKRQASPCGLFDLTLASKTEECSPLDNFCAYVSSSSPEFRLPKIRRAKRRKAFQSPGPSESSSSVAPAVSRKKKRGRQKAKPPPAKPVQRSRPRRGDAAPMRHALRGARLESSETATSSGLGTGSSSRNWDGRDGVAEVASDPAIAMLQKEFSMIEKHKLATETCRSRRARSVDASNNSVPLLLLPESGSSWATARRKRRERGTAEGSSQSPPESRKRMKRLSSERKRTALQVESGNVVESVSRGYLASGRTPLAEAVLPRLGEHWSPNFASTPAPRHLQKEVVCGKKAFFLNLLDQSSRASLADVTNSILANDSFAYITQHERVEMLRSRGGCDAPSNKDKDRNSELQDVTWNLHQKDVPPGKLSLLKGLRVTLVDLATKSSEDGGCKPQELSSGLARQDFSKKIMLKDLRVSLTDILSQTQGKLKSGGKQRLAKRSKSNGSSRDVLTEILQKYKRVGLTDISPQSKFYPQECAAAAATDWGYSATSKSVTSTSATSSSATSSSAASPSAVSPSASSSSLTSSNAMSSSVTKSLALSRQQSDASSSNYLSSQNASAEILPRNPRGKLTDILPETESLPSSSSRREPSTSCRNVGSSTSRGLMVNGLTSNLQCWDISTDVGLREVRVSLTRLPPQIGANLGKLPLGEGENIVPIDSSGADSAILKLSCVTSMAADSTGLQVVQAEEQRRFSELSEDHVEESLKKPSLQDTRENKLPKAKIVSRPSCIAAASPLQREASLSGRRSSVISRRSKIWASIPRKSILPPLAPDPFEMLLDFCRQEEALTFDQALNFKSLRSCRKIGEGLYGEVFCLQRGSETSVVKIVPVGGSVLVNTEQQKSVEQILPEVIISLDLSSLRSQASGASCRSFIELKRVHCIQDAYHRVLLKQWDLFDSKKGSENDRPDFYEASQMFVVFEFADGGESLECFKIRTAGEAESIFLQVACALAAAEVALEYEHRDLHWGNLLVTRTPEERASYRLPEGTVDLDTCGVCVSLIDYSLSRLRKGGTVIFTDLSEDASLFEGTGDHQFEVYRLMKQHNGNDWKSFTPYTNVLWLHYLLQKLLQEKNYCKTGIRHEVAVGRLCNWANLVLLCNSASEFVRNCGVTERNPSAPRLRRRNIRV